MTKEKKGSIGKGILQFFIFFILMGVGMVWGKESLGGLIVFELALFRYCFVSYKDKNPLFDKLNFIPNLKSKKRWIRFIIIGLLSGRLMLGDYQGEGSEKIHNFQNSTVSNMEQFNDKLDKGIEDTTNELVEEAGNL